MLTRQQTVDLWVADDLISLGMYADAVRKQLHPEAMVSYTLHPEENVLEHVFSSENDIHERIAVLERLNSREHGDFAAFRPLVQSSATGMEYMKTVALSRLCLTNVAHIEASLLFGLKLAQIALRFGADDLGVVGSGLSEEEVRRVIRDAGFVPKQRDALFRTYSLA
jgi:cyclic dehypoxanthinyl futalosine synthase